MRGIADSLGLPFAERTHTYNSRRAQELGKWAELQGVGAAFHQQVYLAYFARGLNIARMEILLEIAEQVGLPVGEAQRVLERKTFAAAVDADWRHSRELFISSVPTVIYRNRKLVGFAAEAGYRKLITD